MELPLDLAELPGQKLDKLLILARTQAAYLPLPPEPFNCIPEETPPSVVNSSLHVPKEGPSEKLLGRGNLVALSGTCPEKLDRFEVEEIASR
jgi:hypothetical protein